jgi:NitT/TauT family transport system substrate-binding protein
MMRNVVKALLALTLFLVLGVPGGTQQTAALRTIRVGVLPGEVAGEAYYAQELGIFKKYGLDAQLVPLANGSIVAVAAIAGDIDVGLMDLVYVASAHSRGLPLLYLAPGLTSTASSPALGVLVRNDSAIRDDAKSFAGKTIGVASVNGIATAPTLAWIERNGGDPKALKFVEVPIPQEPEAVARGTIDGAIIYEPWLTLGIAQRGRVVYLDRNAIAPEYMINGWVTSSTWADKNPTTAMLFASAMAETARWANADHAASAPILSKFTKIPIDIVQKMRRADFGITLDAGRVQPVIDAAAEFKMIPRAFPADEIFYHAKGR